MLISEDGGRTWAEHFTPPGLVIDFEVDPEDPDHLVGGDRDAARALDRRCEEVAADRRRVAGSGSRGRRLDALYRAQKDGTVERSRTAASGGSAPARCRASPTGSRRSGESGSTSRSATGRS
jgi:hypothetical protein